MNLCKPACDTRPIDGFWIDARGRSVSPEADPSQLEAVGSPQDELAFYINGINCDVPRQLCDMKKLDKLGFRLVGIHNATAGIARDLAQCVADKLNCGVNPSVTSVKSLLRSAFESGQRLTLIGHSQGALIVSRALSETRREMLADGQSEDAIREKFAQVKLHTAGGASYTYPDGPEYHHLVNLFDPVAMLTGLGSHAPGTHAGEGAHTQHLQRVVAPSESPPCPGTEVKISILDKSLHGVSVYYP